MNAPDIYANLIQCHTLDVTKKFNFIREIQETSPDEALLRVIDSQTVYLFRFKMSDNPNEQYQKFRKEFPHGIIDLLAAGDVAYLHEFYLG